MAHILISTTSLLLLLLPLAAAQTPPSAVNLHELESMMETLRPLGYTLFCNAISTSDLQFQIVSSAAIPSPADDFFTIFAAKDPFLYALDMASDAAAYVSTLRYHVTPNRRLTHSDLANLRSPFLETLLPHYSILVSKNGGGRVNGTGSGNRNGSVSTDLVRVDGVAISDPDIFVGSRIVVHGLDGILVTGIVKNDDLLDDRRPPLVSAPPPGPVVVPSGDEGVSVVPPSSDVNVSVSPSVAVRVTPAVNVPGFVPETVPVRPPVNVPVKDPEHVPVTPAVTIPGDGPLIVPVRPPVNVPVKAPEHVPVRAPVKVPAKAPVKVPVRAPVHVPVRAPVHVPVRAPSGAGKGMKEARRGKRHHVIHQKHHHQVTHSNRHRQNRKNQVHRRDDL